VQYSEGSFGRVFVVKFEDGEDLLEGLKQVALQEQVRVATILLLGGMRSAGVVAGPRQAVIPPEPVWKSFNDGREVIAMGTLFRKDEEPVVHLHGAMGRQGEMLVGCIRKETTTYLVIEAVIAEIAGLAAHKALDEKTGVVMLEFQEP
jgi:predicted DNA-binding protein with PD1-like motif